VAHVYRDGDMQSVVLRQTVATSSREIVPPTDGYFLGLTFSRDGNYLYYVKGERGSNVRALYQVPLLGGDSRQLLYDVDSEVTQSPDGKKIAFIRGYFKEKEKALFIANADGSGEERLTTRRAPQFNGMDHPSWSPDGKRVAFIVSGDDAEGYYVNIDEISVEDRAERKISSERWRHITSIAWLGDGSGVLAVARDRASIAGSPPQIWRINYPGGEAHRITSDVNYYISLSLTADSKMLVAGASAQTSSIVIAEQGDTNRTREILSKNFAGLSGFSWTSDGRMLYSSSQRENRDIWIVNADGSGQKQLTFDPAGDLYPSASPDGRYIVFLSNRGNRWSIWRMNPDGSNAIELARTDAESPAPRVSPDSRWVFYSANTTGKQIVWKISIDGGTPTQLNGQEMYSLSVSPDGQLIAYYHRPPEFNAPVQVHIVFAETGAVIKTLPVLGDGNRLSWSPDGKEIDYVETREGVSNLMRMPLDGGKPRQLTDWKTDQIFWFAWSTDGKQLACTRGSNDRDLILMEDLNLVQ
jgi:TolB protein